MITEDYVSFETAKLLKEKGFKGECLGVYFPNGRFDTFDTAFDYNLNDGNLSHAINAPTLQMAMKWLREIHKIQLWAEPYEHEKEYNAYVRVKWFIHQWQGVGYKSNEEACEAAIKYCLENLI